VADAQNFAASLGKKPPELTEQEWDRFLQERDAGH
jgi:hypothetical protein